MFNATMFAVGSQASLVYPNSKTNEPQTRNGIVEKVGATYVVLKEIDTGTQADRYKTYTFSKIIKVN